MATTETRTHQNYIGGEWVDAASGETFESTSPADGELIGTFPRSGAEDVDRAVAAAKDGVRGVAARARAEARRDPLPLRAARRRREGRAHGAHDARDGEGEGRGRRRRPGSDRHELLHGRRGPSPVRADDAVGAPEQVPDVRPHADRRRRGDHAVELPDRDSLVEDRPGARRGEHRRLQAGDGYARARPALRRAPRRGRRSEGRREHRARRRRRGRRRGSSGTRTSPSSRSPARARRA